jgi:transposase InsO family protein
MPDLAERREVEPGDVLHCDLKGPLDLAYNKTQFTLVVVDEATRVVSTQALRSKADVPQALEIVFADFARHPLLKKIRIGSNTTLHTDSEAVLGSARLVAMLSERGVSLRASPPYAHERNGITERAIQSLFDTTRALLQQADMQDALWPHICATARRRRRWGAYSYAAASHLRHCKSNVWTCPHSNVQQ